MQAHTAGQVVQRITLLVAMLMPFSELPFRTHYAVSTTKLLYDFKKLSVLDFFGSIKQGFGRTTN